MIIEYYDCSSICIFENSLFIWSTRLLISSLGFSEFLTQIETAVTKNDAIEIAKEFPNKQVNSIKFETTHMEVMKYNDKYRSWRLIRVSRDFQ